ncbi:MAG: hypothetical protein ACI92B_002849 [Marinobacter maritimus]|jgi:hypothetical protein|tara:strand:+ start:295 stop:423 length:129 start_codon:yes stop_codon:yes gene_type:complete
MFRRHTFIEAPTFFSRLEFGFAGTGKSANCDRYPDIARYGSL